MHVRISGLMLAVVSLWAVVAAFFVAGGVAGASGPPTNLASSLRAAGVQLPASHRANFDTITPQPTKTFTSTPDYTRTPTPTGTWSPCDLAWSMVPGPGPERPNSEIRGVAAISVDDVWAVGYHDYYETLAAHWDGTAWSVIPSPNVGRKSKNLLYGVSAVSTEDVWAVGSYDGDSTWQTLVERWKDGSWSVIPSPNLGSNENHLKAVSAISASDVWAVGYYYNIDIGEYQTLVEHWDGLSWSVVPSINLGADSNQLYGVAAISEDDVWAVGYYYGSNYTPMTLVQHWDGTAWSAVHSPNVGTSSNQLSAVAIASPTEVWAVGYYYSGSTWQTLTERWKDGLWSVVPSPNSGTQENYLNGVAALSRDDVWAVGYDYSSNYTPQTLVEHWDGLSWSVVPSPNAPMGYSYLNGVAALSRDDVWAVGQRGGSTSSTYRGLLEHYGVSCEPTGTPTATPTDTATPTVTFTPTSTPEPGLITGHVTWQGPPAQPNARQALPISISLQLQSGGPAAEYSGLSTNSSGVFTITSDTADGGYYWRVKGPRYLASSGSAFVARGRITDIQMGTMKVGDANNDNKVTALDFTILANAYGKAVGQPGYDDRADFTGDQVLNSADFTLLRSNFGLAGAPPISLVLATPGLLDRARLHGWRDLGSLHNSAFRESDITYDTATNRYYLFATGSYTAPGYVNMYVAGTPEELVAATPINVAVGVYPSIVKDPVTGHWHLYAENFTTGIIQHYISTDTPTGPASFVLQTAPLNFQVVDVQVRKHPTNGKWYAVGFPVGTNQPLTILWANGPGGGTNGLWTVLGEVFADTGPPPWANYARPDPNLAFTADGRAWVFFTGNVQSPLIHRSAIVEVDIATGKAIGTAVTLSAGTGSVPMPGWHNGENLSDLNFVSVPGQPDRIFGFSNDIPNLWTLDMNWGAIDLEPLVAPSDGRTPEDLVRLDTAEGLEVATGIKPTLLGDSNWGPAGLVVKSADGGAYSYLAGAMLKDLTTTVEFTPSSIREGAISEVANIGAHDYTTAPGIDVQIDAAGEIKVIVTGSDNTTVTLDSEITAQVGARYRVVMRRVGSVLTLTVNGVLKATQTYSAGLNNLEAWSLGAQVRVDQAPRYTFLGTIHSFVVDGSGF